jgi:hypothetical protein
MRKPQDTVEQEQTGRVLNRAFALQHHLGNQTATPMGQPWRSPE